MVQCFVMTYPPKDSNVFWELQEQASCFRAVSLLIWNIHNEICFETSDLWNTQKRKLCFIIYNYQSNNTTESPPIFKVTIIIKYIYVFSDIDECKGNHSCHVNATCTNTNGSYVCECRPGFNGNGQNCTGEFNLFAVIFRIFLLESNLTLLRWSLSAILLGCHM